MFPELSDLIYAGLAFWAGTTDQGRMAMIALKMKIQELRNKKK